jgi:glycosyltransferase 2 family protein
MGRVLQLAFLAAGALLLAALIHSIGLAQLASDLRRFGWGFGVVIALELVVDGNNTLAWRRTFSTAPPVGLAHLFWVRLAGTAVNQVTPTATIGGEVVKVMLLRPYVRTSEAAASIIAARMSYAIGQAALVLVGFATLLGRLENAPELAFAIVLGFALTVAGVFAFVVLQHRGFFTALVDVAARLGFGASVLERLRAGSGALDQRLAVLYRERPGAFAASVAWHFASQLVSLVQLFLVLVWLGTPTALATCLAIEAFALVIDSALFFVPARLGVQEGGRVLVFTTLGLSAATGLAVALILRLTQLALAGLGLAAYGYLSAARPAPAGSPSEP